MAWENLEEDLLEEFGCHAEISRTHWAREAIRKGDVTLVRGSHKTDRSESDFNARLLRRVTRRAVSQGSATPVQKEWVARESERAKEWQREIAEAAFGPDRLKVRGATRQWTSEQISAVRSDISTKELALFLRCSYQLAQSLRARVRRGIDWRPKKSGPKPAGETRGIRVTDSGKFQAYTYGRGGGTITLGAYATKERAEQVALEARRFQSEHPDQNHAQAIRAHVGFSPRGSRAH